MSTNKKDFNVSGPSQLIAVNWENPNHCRIVMASLVNGVYILNDQKNKALAPLWWKFFHFKFVTALHDKKDNSICGALFRNEIVTVKSPEFVIAFRGTQTKKGNWFQDLKLDCNIPVNKLQKRERVKQAFEFVINHLNTSPSAANTWLAGHSLGAAIALLVGKELAKYNCRLETYLFNPPIVSFLMNQFIKDEWLKEMIYYEVRTVIRAGVALSKIAMDKFASKGCVNPFKAIHEWVPHLYVNPADIFCSGYIGYFHNRERMERVGLERVEQIAHRVSLRSLLGSSEPMHVLASAELNINKDKSKGRHSLKQWYDVNLCCETKVYRYKHPK